MEKISILVIAALLFGCSSTDGTNSEVKGKIKSNNIKTSHSAKKNKEILVPTSNTAIIRSVNPKYVIGQTSIASTLEKVFNENGETVYETPLITWSGPKPIVSLPGGDYKVQIGCWANGRNLYNYQIIKAHIENEKDYTFFCLQKIGKGSWGMQGVVGLYGFYTETPELESNQKKYQSEIDGEK